MYYYLLYHGSPNQHKVLVGTRIMYIYIIYSLLFCTSNNYIINSRIYISITYLTFTVNTATITGGQIAGISVGILVIVIVIPTVFALFAVLYCLRRKKLRGSNRMTSQLHPTNQSSTWDQSQNVVAPMKIQGDIAYYTKTPTGLYPSPPMYNDVVEVNIHLFITI